MINLSKTLKLEGLMSIEALVYLAEQAQNHKCIVEVGTFLGLSTRALADNTNGIVYAFDNFEGPWDMDLPVGKRKNILSTFKKNLKDHIESGKVVPIIGDHRFPPDSIINLKPDMVFIDGDHTLVAVTHDISFWKTQLISGGLLCGDDYNFPVVKDVVQTLLGEVNTSANDRIWSINV